MFNLSSPQDQVNNFIVNNAYLVKLKVNVQISPKDNKIEYKLYNPFT